MRKRCNFNLPKPCRIYRNGKLKYVIYADLSRFKKACLNCPHRYVKDKRSYCRINDKDFMMKFYEIDISRKRGMVISVGAIPGRLKAHSLRVEIERYLKEHTKKPKNKSRLRVLNKNLGDRQERLSCFAGYKSKPVV